MQPPLQCDVLPTGNSFSPSDEHSNPIVLVRRIKQEPHMAVTICGFSITRPSQSSSRGRQRYFWHQDSAVISDKNCISRPKSHRLRTLGTLCRNQTLQAWQATERRKDRNIGSCMNSKFHHCARSIAGPFLRINSSNNPAATYESAIVKNGASKPKWSIIQPSMSAQYSFYSWHC
jgi:hypothetical protein